MNVSKKIALGQFFTPKYIAHFMIELLPKDLQANILEPSCGNGIFIQSLLEKGFKNITGYEIDNSIIKDEFRHIIQNRSFISTNDNLALYDYVIGNPPYVRRRNLSEQQKVELDNNNIWKKYFNNLCDYFYIFILKSIMQLKNNGILLFICPDYFFSTKNAKKLREFMMESGYFEEIFIFNENKIFDKVSSSIIIFKYRKSLEKTEQKIKITNVRRNNKIDQQSIKQITDISDIYFIDQFKNLDNWSTSPNYINDELDKFETLCSDENKTYTSLNEICDIGNGMVSGLDKAFQMDNTLYNDMEKNNSIIVYKAKNLAPFINYGSSNYIFIKNNITEYELCSQYPNFYRSLNLYRDTLDKRYNYNRKINYWEWTFLRNHKLFSRNEKKIFVPCKERITNKNYLRFSLVPENVYPTQDVTALFRKDGVLESLEYILAYLNSKPVFHWLKHRGTVKGGIIEFSEKPLSRIPFRRINWHNNKEVEIHNNITLLVQNYIYKQEEHILLLINKQLSKLGIQVHL